MIIHAFRSLFYGDKMLKIYVVALAMALSVALAGCGNEEAPKVPPAEAPAAVQPAPAVPVIGEESEKIFQKALATYGEGNQESALALAQDAIAKDPNNYKAYSLEGLLIAFAGRPDEGAARIEKALAINPGYTQAFFDMAMAKKLGSHYDESIRYFEKVLAVDPKNTWSYYGIATNYADKKDKEKSLAYLTKALALDGEHVRAEALTQDHFAWMRGDPEFQKVVRN